MTPEQIDRVFGRGRLQMVTGDHVEVFREAAAVGDRRRYTKHFLNTAEADFGQWTEREWRILARLIGHGIDCVPEVVQFDRGGQKGTQLVQTYDAGATVDQWATILPVVRGGRLLRHVFEDCAHWWALAQHCLRALFAIHELSVVHLDIKGDNVCIPVGPASFDPHGAALSIYPRFDQLALIDFAFALVSRESLTTALPLGWQTEYDYQSPRLLAALEAGRRGDLRPTRELDWRCDMYSLAAMLKRYLPDEDAVLQAKPPGWSTGRAAAARELILALRDAHDRDIVRERPHEGLMRLCAAQLGQGDLAASLRAGFTLARDATVTPVAPSPITPLTRLAPSIRVHVSPRAVAPLPPPAVMRRRPATVARTRRGRSMLVNVLLGLVAALGVAAMAAPWLANRWPELGDRMRAQSPAGQRDSEASRTAAPPAVEKQVAQAPAPMHEEPTPPMRNHAETAVAKTIPPVRRAIAAAQSGKPVLPEPARVVPAPTTPPTAAGSTAPPRRGATASVAPPRVRFYEPPPEKLAIAAPHAPVAPEPVKDAAKASPPPASEPVAVAAPIVDAKSAPQAAPRPVSTTTTTTTIMEPRALLSFLFNLGKRSDAAAPIEDRTARDRTAAPPPAPVQAYRVVSPPIAAPAAVEAPAREPAPRAVPPESMSPQPVDLAARARRMIVETLPAAAARVEPEVARVFAIAAHASHPAQDRSVVEAVSRPWDGALTSVSYASSAPGMARQLSEDARQAFMAQRDVDGAFDLQLRAFGANPRDPELAANLAYLNLRIAPPQAEVARRLVLFAIAATPPAARAERAEDWTTLAIANALTGRDTDAASALFVAIALTRNLDRTCRGVFRAVEEHGGRVVPAAQAMLARLRQQGRDYESGYCSWPSRVNTARGG